jgi:hypothetical protein
MDNRPWEIAAGVLKGYLDSCIVLGRHFDHVLVYRELDNYTHLSRSATIFLLSSDLGQAS